MEFFLREQRELLIITDRVVYQNRSSSLPEQKELHTRIDRVTYQNRWSSLSKQIELSLPEQIELLTKIC